MGTSWIGQAIPTSEELSKLRALGGDVISSEGEGFVWALEDPKQKE